MRVVATPGVRKSVWLVAASFALAVLAAVLLLRLAAAGDPDSPPPLRADVPAAAPKQEVSPPERIAPAEAEAPRTKAAPRTARARRIEPAPEPTEPPAYTIAPPGEKSGMALFSPPGTKPIKIGIVVPEDFELPEGYVRHFQTTDDGQMLEAVLLFHPDYEWIDEAGEPIALPADRVVPPELAPEGLPIRMLEPPAQEGDR